MSLPTIAAFALVALVAIATPGPSVLLALSNGSRFGLRRATFGMLGAVTSDFVLIFAVALGLGALLMASEVVFSIVKWAGIAYLAYLGIRMLLSRERASTAAGAEKGNASRRAVYSKGFIVAVTNPKGYLFAGALLPQFVDAGAPQAMQYAVFGIVFATIDFLIMLAYAGTGSQLVRFVRRSSAVWLDRFCGTLLLGLAASLVFIRRADA